MATEDQTESNANEVAETEPEARYITKIHLENFQDHTDTIIELEPGINLITGSSDAGKSAALRALNFVLHNQPRGDAFIQLGASEAIVTIEFSDGMTAQRIKGKSRNAILINHPDWKEPITKDNFGKDYPDEVLKALGNPPIDAEQGPISYAEQMSPLFLVSLSSTELPRCLSRLTGIDDFEEATKILSSKSTAANKAVNLHNQRIEGIVESLNQYSTLDEETKRLEKIEKLSLKLSEITKKIKLGESLLSRYNLVMQSGRAANNALKAAQKIADLREKLDPLIAIAARIEKANSLLQKYDLLCTQEAQHLASLESAEKMAKLMPSVARLKELKEQWEKGESLLARYEDVMRKGRSINTELKHWEGILDKAQKAKEDIIEQMRAKGIWCDSCNRPLIEAAPEVKS